jgi:hypothetical protein
LSSYSECERLASIVKVYSTIWSAPSGRKDSLR